MMMQNFETDEGRWLAVRARDRAADGRFIVAVRTTGVYCRPHCPSRMPLRANVRFYDDAAQAERDGFRACKRCAPAGSPRHPAAEAVARACRRIESAPESPRLAELAAAAGLSPFHFHRVFKKLTGVTPKQYAAAHRARRLRTNLRTAGRITDAVYDAGFATASRAYEAAPETLGMTAGAYRAGAPGERIAFTTAPSSLGLVGVAATERGVCAIEFVASADAFERALRERFPRAEMRTGDPALAQTVTMVVRRIERPDATLDLPLDVRGTAFQLRVWEALRRIPPGATASYSEVAAAIGAPHAVRAVGSACGANRIALAIPCHRVRREDGGEGGYRWGIERKRALARGERDAKTEAGDSERLPRPPGAQHLPTSRRSNASANARRSASTLRGPTVPKR